LIPRKDLQLDPATGALRNDLSGLSGTLVNGVTDRVIGAETDHDPLLSVQGLQGQQQSQDDE
jgi:hypothetical protein